MCGVPYKTTCPKFMECLIKQHVGRDPLLDMVKNTIVLVGWFRNITLEQDLLPWGPLPVILQKGCYCSGPQTRSPILYIIQSVSWLCKPSTFTGPFSTDCSWQRPRQRGSNSGIVFFPNLARVSCLPFFLGSTARHIGRDLTGCFCCCSNRGRLYIRSSIKCGTGSSKCKGERSVLFPQNLPWQRQARNKASVRSQNSTSRS